MVDLSDFKILLVNPVCQDRRITSEDSLIMPIGLYYMGALLKENNLSVQLVNLAEEHDPDAYFSWLVQKEKPDMIGFSVLNANRIHAMAAASAARRILPEVTIVFGGPCATFMDSQLLEMNPDIDFIIRAEGEYALLDLIRALSTQKDKSFEAIPGLVFRKKGTIFRSPDRDLIPDLDMLPHPSRYFTYHHLSMSRGCPGKCTFCSSPRFWGHPGTRFHSARWLSDEVKALYDKGIKHFFISDDTFTMDRERVIEWCQKICSLQMDITWNAISRVDYIDEELLSWMRKAGCIQISYGVESGSESIRKRLGKPLKDNDIIRAFQLTTLYGIMPRAYFIYGSPGETSETIRQSCDLMLKIKPLSCVFYILTLFPGTFLYQKAVEKGQISPSVWEQPIEDMPWFEIDPDLNFERTKKFGDQLRHAFFTHLSGFAETVELKDDKELYPLHADFLSRLAMTFSHGEYSGNPLVKNPGETAETLYRRSLSYNPNFRAFLGLAMLHQHAKDFKKAISILGQGLSHFPDNKDLNLCMALNHMNINEFNAALSFLERFKHLPEIRQYIDICNRKLKG